MYKHLDLEFPAQGTKQRPIHDAIRFFAFHRDCNFANNRQDNLPWNFHLHFCIFFLIASDGIYQTMNTMPIDCIQATLFRLHRVNCDWQGSRQRHGQPHLRSWLGERSWTVLFNNCICSETARLDFRSPPQGTQPEESINASDRMMYRWSFCSSCSFLSRSLCLMLVNRTVRRPRRRRWLIEVDRYRDRMENSVRPGVRYETQVRPDDGRLDRQRHVEGTSVVQGEDRHPVRRRGSCFIQTGAVHHRRRARLDPLRREPLLDWTLELVVGRSVPAGHSAGHGRRAVRVGAVVAIVADDHRRWHDRRPQQRALRVPERAHTRAGAVIRVTAVRLAYCRNARMRVATAVHRAVHHR